jgi:replicative DNA helicase
MEDDELNFDIDFTSNIEENSIVGDNQPTPLEPDSQVNTMEDLYETTLQDYDEFERQAWAKGKGYELPNFKNVENNLEGLDSGLYLFAAESNVGKSAVMMNMLHNACTAPNNKLFGVYYSLDDSSFEIIPRIVAMDQLIPISAVAKPQRYRDMIESAEEDTSIYEDWLLKREDGLNKLREQNERFKIVDSRKIRNANDLYEHIKSVIIYVKAIKGPDWNVIIAIDSINDVRLDGHFNSAVEENSKIARTIKDWTVEFDIAIFASTHLRKINANRRPILDDLKESGEYVYEASVVWLLYNDVSKNKQAAQICQITEDGKKLPVIEMDWAKNKKSSYKGRSFMYFSPEYSKVTECGDDANKRFEALSYQS